VVYLPIQRGGEIMPDKYVRVTFDVEIKMSEKKARKFDKARTVVRRGEKWLDHNHKMRTISPEKYRKQKDYHDMFLFNLTDKLSGRLWSMAWCDKHNLEDDGWKEKYSRETYSLLGIGTSIHNLNYYDDYDNCTYGFECEDE
jgi:hypothetical protein